MYIVLDINLTIISGGNRTSITSLIYYLLGDANERRGDMQKAIVAYGSCRLRDLNVPVGIYDSTRIAALRGLESILKTRLFVDDKLLVQAAIGQHLFYRGMKSCRRNREEAYFPTFLQIIRVAHGLS